MSTEGRAVWGIRVVVRRGFWGGGFFEGGRRGHGYGGDEVMAHVSERRRWREGEEGAAEWGGRKVFQVEK